MSPVASTCSGGRGEYRESLISADARSRASCRFATAASSAANSAASRHAPSRLAMPGKGVALTRTFFKLSHERMWPSSCWTATRSSLSLRTDVARSETITVGLQIPTRIKGGQPCEELVSETERLSPALRIIFIHRSMARDVLVCAFTMRNNPAPRIIKEHTARTNVAMSSSREGLSSSQNDGKAKKTATVRDNTYGKIRRPKSKWGGAERALESNLETATTSNDRGQ